MSEKQREELKKAIAGAEISDAELDEISGGAEAGCWLSCTSCDAACSPGCQPGSLRGTDEL